MDDRSSVSPTERAEEPDRGSEANDRRETNGTNVAGHPLVEMLRWDVRVQTRYGIVPVYAVLTVLFVLGLLSVGESARIDATVLLITLDPAVLGFYFIAVLVLFEKGDGVLDALVVSPLGPAGYLLSKDVTLSALATTASVVVILATHGVTLRLPLALVGVALAASLFVLLGFVAVARFDSVNEYFLSAPVWGGILFLPILGFLGLVETPLFYLLPVQPLLVLVEAGLRPVELWRVVYAIAYLVVGNVVVYSVALRSFKRHVVRGGDPGRKLGHSAGSGRQRWNWSNDDRSPWVGLVSADLKNWVRDPMLTIAAVGPFLLAFVVRFAAPVVTEFTAGFVDLTTYYPVIAGTMTVFGPGIYGFVVGMFVLEDRDQNVLTAYRTSPLSLRGYLLYRGTTATVFGFLSTLPAVVGVGLVQAPPAVIVASAALGSLSAPVIALSLGLVASNSIEGIALSKFENVVLLGPAAVVAVVPEPWQFAAGVFPPYWPVKTFVVGATGDPSWPVFLVGGVVVHVLALGALIRWAVPRISD